MGRPSDRGDSLHDASKVGFPQAELPRRQDLAVDIRRHYRWLYLPLLSWIFLVFPLFFLPIPLFFLGPVGIAIFPSTTRRKTISFFRRSYAYVGRQPPATGEIAMFRWTGDVLVNLVDVLTLGLSNLFAAAGLLKEMIAKDGSDEELSEPDPVAWLLKWLLLGNVLFIAVYIVCPGLILEPLLQRLERHLLLSYEPLGSAIEVDGAVLTCQSITSWQELQEINQRQPVLLYADIVSPEHEAFFLEKLKSIAADLAPDLVDGNILVGWCNLQGEAPSHYRDLTRYLKSARINRPGWLYFVGGKLVATRPVNPTERLNDQRIANLARQAVGAPESITLPKGRVDPPDVLIDTLETAMAQSQTSPALVVTFRAGKGDEAPTILAIREKLLPGIRQALEEQGAHLFVANSGHPENGRLRSDLKSLRVSERNFLYIVNRQVVASEEYGFLWTWDDYVKDVNAALGNEVPADLPETRLRYYVVTAIEEALHLSERQPVVLVAHTPYDAATTLGDFGKNILPDVSSRAEKKGAIVCWHEGRPAAPEVAKNGVTLVKDRIIGGTVEIKPARGDALIYAETIKSMLEAL